MNGMSSVERTRRTIVSPRQLITHEVDVNQLFTIETLNDEYDLVADRNLTTGEIIGLNEVDSSFLSPQHGEEFDRFGMILDVGRTETCPQRQCRWWHADVS